MDDETPLQPGDPKSKTGWFQWMTKRTEDAHEGVVEALQDAASTNVDVLQRANNDLRGQLSSEQSGRREDQKSHSRIQRGLIFALMVACGINIAQLVDFF